MKASTKIIVCLILLGIVYCICSIVNDHGGSSLRDVFGAISYISNFIFIISLITIIVNRRNLKGHKHTFIFLLLSLPLTIGATIGLVEKIYKNRPPDLTIRYPRPVTQNEFYRDSVNAELAIDCLVVRHNRQYGGPDIKYGVLDTIIYSPSGNEVFIIYAKKFEQNDWGNDFDPDYFSATKRSENNQWELEAELHNKIQWGGSYQSMQELRKSVRKFYFNEYKFRPTDSLEENYFWKTKNNR